MTEIDQIIDEAPEVAKESTDETEKLRERLITVAEAGKSREYLGKSITSDEIESLDQKELRKLYARYEAHIGGVVTSTMKKHFVTTYVNLVQLFLPKNLVIADREALEASLNKGPFIDLALSKWTCKLYHRFGDLLAPAETALLTSNQLENPSASVEVEDDVQNVAQILE